MGKISLLGFKANDPHEIEDWEISNSLDHEEIRQAIQRIGGPNLMNWLLFPVNWKKWDLFAIGHQNTHNDMNAFLGLSGSDLTQVDFKNAEAAAAWHQTHFSEHQAAWEVLNLNT
jgi:hypothetical protein